MHYAGARNPIGIANAYFDHVGNLYFDVVLDVLVKQVALREMIEQG